MRRMRQHALIIRTRFLHQLHEQLCLAARGGACLLRHGQADLLGELPDRLWKRQAVLLHEKREDVAPDAAAKTMKNLLVRVDMKRRGALLVKRAERLEMPARPFERHVLANHLGDVHARLDVV